MVRVWRNLKTTPSGVLHCRRPGSRHGLLSEGEGAQDHDNTSYDGIDQITQLCEMLTRPRRTSGRVLAVKVLIHDDPVMSRSISDHIAPRSEQNPHLTGKGPNVIPQLVRSLPPVK